MAQITHARSISGADVIEFALGDLTTSIGDFTIAFIGMRAIGEEFAPLSVSTPYGYYVNWISGAIYLTDDTITWTGPDPNPQTYVLYAGTKVSGSATPRHHFYDYSSPGWSHTNDGDGAVSNFTTPSGSTVEIKGTPAGGGEIVVVAVWHNAALSDGQIEGLTDDIAAWDALSPTALWLLNQSSTATPVLDRTAGNADQSSITGTTVVDITGGLAFDVGGDEAGGVRTYKRLYGPAQLTASAADLYTCPASTVARVLGIHASNPSGSPVDINLSIGTDAAGTRVYDDFEIPADSVKTNFDPYELAAGEKIQGWASFSPRLVDDFNRANAANLGTCSVVGSWSGSVNGSTDGWQIISNQAAPDTGSGMSSVHSETYGPDVQLGVTLATKQADGQYCGLFGRVTDANTVNFDGYYIEYTAIAGAANDIFRVYRTVNGSGTQLTTPASSITYELSSGNKWGCEIRGTGATVTIEIFVDTGSGWTSIGTFTDTHADRRVTAGRTAIYGDSSTLRFDDYGIGPSTVLTITGYEDPV